MILNKNWVLKSSEIQSYQSYEKLKNLRKNVSEFGPSCPLLRRSTFFGSFLFYETSGVNVINILKIRKKLVLSAHEKSLSYIYEMF